MFHILVRKESASPHPKTWQDIWFFMFLRNCLIKKRRRSEERLFIVLYYRIRPRNLFFFFSFVYKLSNGYISNIQRKFSDLRITFYVHYTSVAHIHAIDFAYNKIYQHIFSDKTIKMIYDFTWGVRFIEI